MARALIESQAVLPSGVWPTLVPAVAAGHRFANTFGGEARMFLLVTNAHTSPVTVTIPSTFVRDGLTLANRIVTVPNGTSRLIGPILGEFHNQLSGADTGQTYVDYSVVTAITVAVLRI